LVTPSQARDEISAITGLSIQAGETLHRALRSVDVVPYRRGRGTLTVTPIQAAAWILAAGLMAKASLPTSRVPMALKALGDIERIGDPSSMLVRDADGRQIDVGSGNFIALVAGLIEAGNNDGGPVRAVGIEIIGDLVHGFEEFTDARRARRYYGNRWVKQIPGDVMTIDVLFSAAVLDRVHRLIMEDDDVSGGDVPPSQIPEIEAPAPMEAGPARGSDGLYTLVETQGCHPLGPQCNATCRIEIASGAELRKMGHASIQPFDPGFLHPLGRGHSKCHSPRSLPG